jgi:predicted CoA-binding protein
MWGYVSMNVNVAILGATDDPEKYAYKALAMLREHGYRPIPINPKKTEIDGLDCYPSLHDFPEPVDTVTLYVRPAISSGLIDDILAAEPRRVIMNPGTENDALEAECGKHGIEVLRACTLVMLSTGQF